MLEAAALKQSSHLGVLVADLKEGLARHDTEYVRGVFGRVAARPVDLDSAFEDLQAAFSEAGQNDLLLDLMLAGSPVTLSRMRMIERTFAIGLASRREEEVLDAVGALVATPGTMVVTWDAAVRMAFAKRFGKRGVRDLMRLKYLGVSCESGKLLNIAEILADRIEVSKPLLDRLYARTRHPDISRPEWERRVRTAFAIDHVTKDFLGMTSPDVANWLGARQGAIESIRRQVDETLADVDRSKGVVVATFHGGFSRLNITLFQHLFPNSVTVLGGLSKAKSSDVGRYIRVVGNERGSLFQALRAVQDGKALWIGADAPFGNSKHSIEVIGAKVPVADGAPFVAFETRCPTLWLATVRTDFGFSVVSTLGPVRAAGEKYQAFKDRWFSFYRTCIEEFLTGDPRNLALRPHWMHYLGGGVFRTSNSPKTVVGVKGEVAAGGPLVMRLSEKIIRPGRDTGLEDARVPFDWL